MFEEIFSVTSSPPTIRDTRRALLLSYLIATVTFSPLVAEEGAVTDPSSEASGALISYSFFIVPVTVISFFSVIEEGFHPPNS